MLETIRSCIACGTPLAAADRQCRGCGAANPLPRQSLFRIVTGAAAANAPSAVEDAGPVVITSSDFMQLEELACLQLDRGDPITRRLREMLDHCRVVPPASAPPDIVTLDARVQFSVDGGPVESRVLVLPDGHGLYGWSLPVTTPRGLAMLGRRTGATALAEGRDGGVERIAIRSVAHPSDSAAALALPVAPGEGRWAEPLPMRPGWRSAAPEGPDDTPRPPAA